MCIITDLLTLTLVAVEIILHVARVVTLAHVQCVVWVRGQVSILVQDCCNFFVPTACLMSLQIRGHCVADLDPLGITQARHAETEEEARSKLLTTYRYHTVYNIGKGAPRPVEAVLATRHVLMVNAVTQICMHFQNQLHGGPLCRCPW